jgi:cardiolipin synthase
MKIALLLCYFATWAFIPHLLLLKKRPSATLAWLWAIVFIPYLGALAYLAIGTDRLKRRRLRRRQLHYSTRPPARRGDRTSDDRDPGPPDRSATASSCSSSRINQPPRQLRLTTCGSCATRRNSTPRWRSGSPEARHHIHLEFYIWNPDETGARFLAF